jgi:hypothetical protein
LSKVGWDVFQEFENLDLQNFISKHDELEQKLDQIQHNEAQLKEFAGLEDN